MCDSRNLAMATSPLDCLRYKKLGMFKKLFGSSSTPAVKPPPQSAVNKTIDSIQSLQEHEDQLEKRKALLEKKIEAELQKARELNKAGKKASARAACAFIYRYLYPCIEMTSF